MVEMRKPIQVSEAIERVLGYRNQGATEYVSINDCDNRRLGVNIVAEEPVPSFDKSPYDGFAFSSADTNGAGRNHPVQFKVVEHIGAGQVPVVKLKKGQATRIMTGAKIPEGADCVAMFEICQTYEENGQSFMTIKRQMNAGQNIIRKESEVTRGTKLVDRGKLINPGVKALLATFGYSEVCVAKRPVVGVIATGTELLDVNEELQPGKIRNSNAYMIESQIIRAGGECKYYGKLADEFEPSYKLIRNALNEVDMLITTGGVSVGDFDLMPAIYEKLGADVLFNKVAMRPGSVTTVANCAGKMMFGLSGNPSACYVGFELFTRPVIQQYLFNPNLFLKRISAVLGADFPKPNPFTRFVRCYITYDDAQIQAQLAGMDKSNVVTSLAHSTCLMILPGGTRGFQTGDEVEVLLLEDNDGQREFQHVQRRD
ncbi:molybdopterin molybdotransferase MoeA [Virgibacillus siamensis]|uniref:Molybdopterin molybdenumtransferase n=1 Tax=Virgibacillus siamensis TaxID=480071 RepID=A0ABP3RPE3_9BACI